MEIDRCARVEGDGNGGAYKAARLVLAVGPVCHAAEEPKAGVARTPRPGEVSGSPCVPCASSALVNFVRGEKSSSIGRAALSALWPAWSLTS
jgi:hypothetical protein